MSSVYTVTQINSYIKNMFSQDFLLHAVSVKGEISNCRYHPSGHIYFTLKDMKGTISCVMFAGSRSGLAFRLTDGMQAVVSGSVEIYERDGKYQLYARKITKDGRGYLYEQFELLKNKLEEMGMFAPEYKQPIPRYIRKLGVVTAPTGAAVQDIIHIAARRNPYVQIILYPATVQGETAAASIVKGIRILERENVDVMIVGRGGGSIEDLWAFNEEMVAQAIFDCRVPVISAVGHETDFTIADFAADLRAPTPSAAAELAVYDICQLEDRLSAIEETLKRLVKNKTEVSRYRLLSYRTRLQGVSPLMKIREKRTYALNLEGRLQELMEDSVRSNRFRMELYITRLKGLSPLDKLSQGFSYVADRQGRAVTDISRVEIGDSLAIHVKNGILSAEVHDKQVVDRGGQDGQAEYESE